MTGDAKISGTGVTDNGDGTYTISKTSANLTVTPKVGYKLANTTAVTVAAADAAKGKVQKTSSDSDNSETWLLYDITGDLTLNVATAEQTWTLTVTTDGNCNVDVAIGSADPVNVVKNTTGTNWQRTVKNGETVTFTWHAEDDTTHSMTANSDYPTITMTANKTVSFTSTAIQADKNVDSWKVKGQTVTMDTGKTAVIDLTPAQAADTTEAVVEATLNSDSNKATIKVELNGTELTDEVLNTTVLQNKDQITVTVTAEKAGVTADVYTILVRVTPLSSECKVTVKTGSTTSATISGDSNDEDEHIITLNEVTDTSLAAGSALTALEAILDKPAGATLEMLPTTIQDGGILTVTAADGTTTREYTIRLSGK